VSINVTEANAVNVVCAHILGPGPYQHRPEPREVMIALEVLAAGSHKRIMAGWSQEHVAAFKGRLP